MIGSAYNLAIEQKLVSKNPNAGLRLAESRTQGDENADCRPTQHLPPRGQGQRRVRALLPRPRHRTSAGRTAGAESGRTSTSTEQHDKVQRAISRQNGKVVEAPLKTKNAYRTLPAVGRRDRRTKGTCKRARWESSEWVFPSPTGGPMSPDSVLHMLQRVLKRAGLPRIRFHDLRHTFATMALQKRRGRERPCPRCWVTTPRASRWTPTPT